MRECLGARVGDGPAQEARNRDARVIDDSIHDHLGDVGVDGRVVGGDGRQLPGK
jgi:hypothetical protein